MVQDVQVSVKSSNVILLYGNSILIAGLNRKLENLPGWKVRRILRGEPGDLSQIALVVIDLREVGSAHVLASTGKNPNILLVGIDGLTNSLTLLTGQTQPMRSLQDALDALRKAM